MKTQNFFFLILMFVLAVGISGCANNEGLPEEITSAENNITDQSVLSKEEDGVRVYEAKGSYVSPGGVENLDVKVAIKDGLVEELVMISDTKNEKSVRFQGLFLEGVKKEIVGKKLEEIGEFSKINGSSLTSKGFNEAIAKIKAQV